MAKSLGRNSVLPSRLEIHAEPVLPHLGNLSPFGTPPLQGVHNPLGRFGAN